MNGLHLIADLHDCRCPAQRLLDAGWLESYCVDACQRHGLTVVGRLFHPFVDASGSAAGVTGTVVLAESHLAIIPGQKSAGSRWMSTSATSAATTANAHMPCSLK